MSLEGIGKRLLDARFVGLAVCAILAAVSSYIAGHKMQGMFPGARYVPPVVGILAGLALRKDKEGASYGLAFALGCSADLGMAMFHESGAARIVVGK